MTSHNEWEAMAPHTARCTCCGRPVACPGPGPDADDHFARFHEDGRADPPLVKGGQGRSSESVAVAAIVLLVLCGFVLLGLTWRLFF